MRLLLRLVISLVCGALMLALTPVAVSAQAPENDVRVQQFFLPATSTVGYSVHASSSVMHLTLGSGDIRAAGGYKTVYTFAHSDYLVRNQTNSNVPLAGTVRASTSGSGVLRATMPWAGSVIGVAISARSALTAHAAHAEATINGTGILLRAVIGSSLTQTQYAMATQARDVDTFAAGDQVGCRFTTDASVTPEANELVCTVVVEY